MRTCQEPDSISHKLPLKNRGSALERSAGSGSGARPAADPTRGSGTMRTERRSFESDRTSTSLRALADYELRAVSTANRKSAAAASEAFGVPAFDHHRDLIAHPGPRGAI